MQQDYKDMLKDESAVLSAGGGACDSNVARADCAALRLPSVMAACTLLRKVLSGSVPELLDDVELLELGLDESDELPLLVDEPVLCVGLFCSSSER